MDANIVISIDQLRLGIDLLRFSKNIIVICIASIVYTMLARCSIRFFTSMAKAAVDATAVAFAAVAFRAAVVSHRSPRQMACHCHGKTALKQIEPKWLRS